MNTFGGNWTEAKIEILVEYAKAYLSVMKKNADKYGWKLLYFDGFAGSGFIEKEINGENKIITGAARRILEIDEPRKFDEYYFVEKDEVNVEELRSVKTEFDNSKIHIVNEDCNNKILSMSNFLKNGKGRKYKVLSYIDPCGMQLTWDSLKSLEESNVDVWVLVPTGLGVNRLLKNRGEISEAWIKKLEIFLGMSKVSILEYFYSETVTHTLFGDIVEKTKDRKAIERSAELYQSRLNELFEYVTKPYILKNSTNSIMFHFFMASNNKTAVRIANEIITKYNKIA